MKALDLYCGAGGATRGLQRAGFHVTGIDRKAQSRYIGEEFFQVDITELHPSYLMTFDFVWSSPPCQAHSSMKTMHNAKKHPNLIPQTRQLLIDAGVPFVIENVPGAPLDHSVMLCGSMFGLVAPNGAELRRHRLFETSFPILGPVCQHGFAETVGVYGGHLRNRRREGGDRKDRVPTIGVYGEGARDSRRKFDKGQPDFTVEDGRFAMGIDWMSLAELCQAIPPAYSEWLARAWLAQRESAAA